MGEHWFRDYTSGRAMLQCQQMYARDHGAVRASLQRMDVSPEATDVRRQYSVSLLRGCLAMQCDDTDAVQAIQPELLAIPDDADAFALVGRSHVLAWMFMYQGKFVRTKELLEQGARHSSGSGRHLVGRCLEGMRCALEGHMSEAEGVIRETTEGTNGVVLADIGRVPDFTLTSRADGVIAQESERKDRL